MHSSTIRSAVDHTLDLQVEAGRWNSLRRQIQAEWVRHGKPDMVTTLREHPYLLSQQSLVLELAIDEYEALRHDSEDLDIAEHCERFREFGDELCQSIKCQLEVQRHCGSELLDIGWPENGDDCGGFHVVEQLGAGGAARVYLCLEEEVGRRQVVLKTSAWTSYEASILGRLRHPNITPIYSTGFIDDRNLYYLCMPYIGRSTLADLVEVAFKNGCPRRDGFVLEAANRWDREKTAGRSGSFQWLPRLGLRSYVDEVLRLLREIADALAFAHGEKILHGDLKPSNILLTPAGLPMLLDFNLSQDFDNDKRSCGGTLPYMPPEHLRILKSNARDERLPAFTPASDIYSFGALMYELLAGGQPVANFESSDNPAIAAEKVLNRLEHGIPDVRQFNPLVSRGLARLVKTCMSLVPADRPATMRDVQRALQSERRSISTIIRRARVRPAAFSMLVGLPIAFAASGMAYIAAQPPRYVRDYETGMGLLAAKRPGDAVDYFVSSMNANTSYVPARYELGKARLALGEIDLAMSDFGFLKQNNSHLPSVVYLAYCYNLKHFPNGSIPLYERATEGGISSLAVHNNLAASYIDGSNNLTPNERLLRAEQQLAQAMAIDPDSVSVNLNCVRLATRKANADRSFDPFTSWRNAAAVLRKLPPDDAARLHVAYWWSLAREHKSAGLVKDDPDSTQSVSDSAAGARRLFISNYEAMSPRLKSSKLASTLLKAHAGPDRCYIKP